MPWINSNRYLILLLIAAAYQQSLHGIIHDAQNIYQWMERNSYICDLFNPQKPDNPIFIFEEESEIFKCSTLCGDPIETKKACGRMRSQPDSDPSCFSIPEICLREYIHEFTTTSHNGNDKITEVIEDFDVETVKEVEQNNLEPVDLAVLNEPIVSSNVETVDGNLANDIQTTNSTTPSSTTSTTTTLSSTTTNEITTSSPSTTTTTPKTTTSLPTTTTTLPQSTTTQSTTTATTTNVPSTTPPTTITTTTSETSTLPSTTTSTTTEATTTSTLPSTTTTPIPTTTSTTTIPLTATTTTTLALPSSTTTILTTAEATTKLLSTTTSPTNTSTTSTPSSTTIEITMPSTTLITTISSTPSTPSSTGTTHSTTTLPPSTTTLSTTPIIKTPSTTTTTTTIQTSTTAVPIITGTVTISPSLTTKPVVPQTKENILNNESSQQSKINLVFSPSSTTTMSPTTFVRNVSAFVSVVATIQPDIKTENFVTTSFSPPTTNVFTPTTARAPFSTPPTTTPTPTPTPPTTTETARLVTSTAFPRFLSTARFFAFNSNRTAKPFQQLSSQNVEQKTTNFIPATTTTVSSTTSTPSTRAPSPSTIASILSTKNFDNANTTQFFQQQPSSKFIVQQQASIQTSSTPPSTTTTTTTTPAVFIRPIERTTPTFGRFVLSTAQSIDIKTFDNRTDILRKIFKQQKIFSEFIRDSTLTTRNIPFTTPEENKIIVDKRLQKLDETVKRFRTATPPFGFAFASSFPPKRTTRSTTPEFLSTTFLERTVTKMPRHFADRDLPVPSTPSSLPLTIFAKNRIEQFQGNLPQRINNNNNDFQQIVFPTTTSTRATRATTKSQQLVVVDGEIFGDHFVFSEVPLPDLRDVIFGKVPSPTSTATSKSTASSTSTASPTSRSSAIIALSSAKSVSPKQSTQNAKRKIFFFRNRHSGEMVIAPQDDECVDGDTACDFWAKNGECKANPVYMLTVCRLSCHICTPFFYF